MSTPHALAAVTQVLRYLLDESLRENEISSLLGGSEVTARPPDRILGAAGAVTQPVLNLFLYRITHNPAYRNADLPTRDRRGRIVGNPRLGLDLHYMLTAYSQDDVDLQDAILMGIALERLHREPVPSRQNIEDALALQVPGLANTTLEVSELADQIESIKITPEALSVDDISRLWTAMQHLRTSAFYLVTVVLIESQGPKRTPLPVLTRGPSLTRRVVETFADAPEDNLPEEEQDREAGIAVQPGLIPPVPTLEGIGYENNQIAVRIQESIVLEGHHLDGVEVLVRFTESRSRRTLDVEPTEVSPTRLVVPIPPEQPPPPPELPLDQDPSVESNWRAGFYSVAALVRRPVTDQGELEQRISNELPVVLAPTINALDFDSEDLNGESVPVLRVTCRPPVRRGQRASLIVGQREVPADPLPVADEGAEPPASRFRIDGLDSGADQRVRIVVDGASSIFIDRSQEPPAFLGPVVEIP